MVERLKLKIIFLYFWIKKVEMIDERRETYKKFDYSIKEYQIFNRSSKLLKNWKIVI